MVVDWNSRQLCDGKLEQSAASSFVVVKWSSHQSEGRLKQSAVFVMVNWNSQQLRDRKLEQSAVV